MKILLVDRQAFVSATDATRYSHGASRPGSIPAVSSSSTIRIEYDPSYQALSWHMRRIHREAAATDALAIGGVRIAEAHTIPIRGRVLGKMSATLFVRDVRIGDVVEYAYSLSGHQPALRNKYAERSCSR